MHSKHHPINVIPAHIKCFNCFFTRMLLFVFFLRLLQFSADAFYHSV